MIISSIYINAFGGVSNLKLELNDELNVIYGANEAGKSTIESFIKIMLYGFSNKRINGENERKKYIPFDGKKMSGELIFIEGGRSYILKRTFGNTKKDDTALLYDAINGEKITDIDAYEVGREILNINRNTFEKTLFISQLGVAVNKDKEEEIINKLYSMCGCLEDEVPAKKALEKLEAMKKEFTTARGKGILEELKNKEAMLIQENYELFQLSEDNLQNINDLNEQKEKRKRLKEEIDELILCRKYIKQKELNFQYDELCKDIIQNDLPLDKQKESLQKKKIKITDAKNKAIHIVNKYNILESFDYGIKDKVNESLYKQKLLNEKLQANERLYFDILNEKKELEQRSKVWENKPSIKDGGKIIKGTFKEYEENLYELQKIIKIQKQSKNSIKTIIAIILIISGIALCFVNSPINFIGIALLILGTLGAYRYITSRILAKDTIKRLQSNMEDVEEEINRFLNRGGYKNYTEVISDLKKYDEYIEFKNKVSISLEEKTKILNMDEYLRCKEEYEKSSKYINMLMRCLKVNSPKELTNILEVYYSEKEKLISLNKIEQEDERKLLVINKLLLSGMSIEEFVAKGEMDKIKDKYNFETEEAAEEAERNKNTEFIECEKKIKDIENAINTKYIGKRSLIEVQEELFNVREEIKVITKKIKALDIAMSNIQEAFNSISKDIGPTINKLISSNFNELSHGKYSEVRFSNDYDMLIREDSNLFKCNYLSNGALDQLYLSLRLAFIELLYHDCNQLIILDDAFVQYDDERRKTALLYLHNKLNGQKLLFTCQKIEERILIDNSIKFNLIVI